jgi:hypothetical protein
MTSLNRLVISIAFLLSGVQAAQAATIYRCNVNGRTVFQQSACASDEAASAAAPASGPARKTTKPALPPAPASGASAPEQPAKPARPG